MMIRDDTVNTTTCAEEEKTDIEIRAGQWGNLFGVMTHDRKHLRIMRGKQYVDLFVNKYGRLQVVKEVNKTEQ